jgi:Zn-dependent protease with chaperone function
MNWRVDPNNMTDEKFQPSGTQPQPVAGGAGSGSGGVTAGRSPGFCHFCGKKSSEAERFCSSCGANLDIDYDFDYTLLETTDQSASLNDFVQMIPTTRIVEVFLDKLGTPWIEAQMLGTAVKVGKRQFPDIYQVAEECASMFAVPRIPKIYLDNYSTFFLSTPYHVITVGTNDDPVILIDPTIIKNIGLPEMRFLFAREMGHIKMGHPVYITAGEIVKAIASNVAGQALLGPRLDNIAGGVLGSILINQPLIAAMNAWIRATHYSADKAGMVAVGDLQIVKSFFAMFITGWNYSPSSLAARVDMDAFLDQAEELERSVGRYSEYLGPLGNLGPLAVPQQFNPGYSLPFTVKRYKAILDFVKSAEYREARELVAARGIGRVRNRYCVFCGASLGESPVCPSCGKATGP